jgi:predicted MFS family arabinose efflux permease
MNAPRCRPSAGCINRLGVLTVGFMLLVAADVVLAFSDDLWGLTVGIALWGVHMGLTQGLLATLVADTAAPELRGTAGSST